MIGSVEVPTTGLGEVRLRAVSRREWADLMDKHPAPTGRGSRWGSGFLPALLRASVVGQTLTVADAANAMEDVDDGDLLETALIALSQPGISQRILDRLEDPRLRAELDYCGFVKITHPQFLSLPDDAQDMAVAWWLNRINVCPGCGVPADDMTRPQAAWMPRARACLQCETKHDAENDVPEERRHATHVDLIRAD